MTVSSTGSSVTSTGSSVSVNGLVSGINTQQVITALLQGYQIPITDLQNRQSAATAQASDYQTIASDLQSLSSAAQQLDTPSSWDLMAATTSSPTVATASPADGATPGSLTFTVNALAQGNVLVSQGSVSSPGTIVTTAPSLLVATGAGALGFASLGAAGGVALGSHILAVTQSSQAATVAGASPLPGITTVVAGSNDTLDVSVNGTSYSLTLAAGTFTPAELATAIDQAAAAAGAPLTASVSGAGALQLASLRQGSAATIEVTGGDAASGLGLGAGPSGVGVDAVVSVDGTQSTLDSIDPGQQVTLAAPSGSLSATVASSVNAYGSLLGVGTADAALVSTGNGSLSQVIANVNAAGLGATASSVTLPSGGLLLQVGAGRTGLAGSVSVDPAAFAGSGLGSLQSVTAAQDASVSVGGASGYTLTSATNVFSNLLPGTAVTVGAVGQATVSVQPDASGEATKVASLVSAANQALSDIASLGGYDATTKTAGPLMGSAVLSGLQQAILSVFGSARGTSSLANAAGAGITLGSDGTLSFDQAAFESAYAANPSTVQALFTQGVSFAPAQPAYAGEVSLLYAGDQTPAGSYDVAVTQSATQATDLGTALAGSVSVAEALTFTQGGSSATYQTAAGEGTAAIASGLNRAFAQQGLSLEASVDSSGALEVASSGYGSIQSFEVTSSASGPGASGLGGDPGAPVTFAGTDVEGTINGEAATGAGQVLAASATGDLAGLSVLVQAEGISGATDLGSVTYSPGVAQQLATLADGATNSVSGSLTVTMKGLADEAAGYDSGIAQYQQLEASQQTVLENEFATMEATLGTLKNESSLLSSQINQLPGF